MRFNIFLMIALMVLGYAVTLYLDHESRPEPRARIESETAIKKAPDFAFSAKGEKLSLKDFKGRIVILNFWASWCAPCVREFPELLKIARDNQEKVAFIALSSDIDDASMNSFLKRLLKDGTEWKAENIYIARDMDNISGELFATFKLPETYIIDENQMIRQKLVGADWNSKELQAFIEGL